MKHLAKKHKSELLPDDHSILPQFLSISVCFSFLKQSVTSRLRLRILWESLIYSAKKYSSSDSVPLIPLSCLQPALSYKSVKWNDDYILTWNLKQTACATFSWRNSARPSFFTNSDFPSHFCASSCALCGFHQLLFGVSCIHNCHWEYPWCDCSTCTSYSCIPHSHCLHTLVDIPLWHSLKALLFLQHCLWVMLSLFKQ